MVADVFASSRHEHSGMSDPASYRRAHRSSATRSGLRRRLGDPSICTDREPELVADGFDYSMASQFQTETRALLRETVAR
jgi:hypothetical protein